jgi:hypothetical protein
VAWVGWVISTVGLVLGIFYFLRNRKTKVISYYTQHTPLIVRKNESIPIEILYDSKPVKNPTVTSIKIRVTGSQEIKSSDFDGNMSIGLPGIASLLLVQVVGTIPERLPVRYNVDSSDIYLEPLLLNPGDGFHLQVLSDGEPDHVNIEARIAGVSRFKHLVPSVSSEDPWRVRLVPDGSPIF